MSKKNNNTDIDTTKNSDKVVETPLMKQYNEIKGRYPDTILLFRVGDFYETFCADAIKTSRILGITLTRRANGSASFVELAGFPYHSLDTYMPKLVQAGERVAICEQLEDPKTTKKIVKRGVTELITPGVSMTDSVMLSHANNFVAAVFFGKKKIGVSFLDFTTGEYYIAEGNEDYVGKLLAAFSPKEVLYQRGFKETLLSTFGNKYYIYHLDEWIFSGDNCENKLMTQLDVTSLGGFGIASMPSGIKAAGALLYYLDQTEHRQTSHINAIRKIDEDNYVWLDGFSMRNLEIFESSSQGGRSLYDVINHTTTAMGARTLRKWLSLPLKNSELINERHDVVSFFVQNETFAYNTKNTLRDVCDMERLVSKVSMGRITPQEMLSLSRALGAVEILKKELSVSGQHKLEKWSEILDPCSTIRIKMEDTISPTSPNNMLKGGYINAGVDLELDELRRILLGSKEYLNCIRDRESEQSGITSLKIGYNNVFGFYLEVTNSHKDKVPTDWIRKQTLTGAERYITPELKEYEEKILGAEEKILAIEQRIYGALLIELTAYTQIIQSNADIVGQIDTLLSFSELNLNGYTRPCVTDDNSLEIIAGRHPIIEAGLPLGEKYIPNDVTLDDTQQQIIIITGPNMSGKSAILRQTAIIVILAQAGSLVPASSAVIGIVDRIFTRVGASDNISRGESTFMVEMLESANILNNMTDRSLVLLDEIGRGTSTYDGISIAWAMVEYLHQSKNRRAKTLFATHYHELNEMEKIYERIKNYNVQIKEVDGKVIFMRKLLKGGTEHSFGIHVARMAGMPQFVVERAEQILESLELDRASGKKNDKSTLMDSVNAGGKKLSKYKRDEITVKESGVQLSLFQLDDPLVSNIKDELKNVDINNMTPMQALAKLEHLKILVGIK